MSRTTYPQDPIEAHSFEELFARWPDLGGPGRAYIFDSSSARAPEACWAGVRDRADARIESERIYEGRLREPWCSQCHDRLTEHAPGDCPKYRIPEKGIPTSRSSDSRRVESDHSDVLKTIPASVYTAAFVGVPVPASGRIACPLHGSDNPSVFKCYGTTWTCFGGCGRGADIYDLASAVTGIEARGAGFIELRRWIAAALLGGKDRV